MFNEADIEKMFIERAQQQGWRYVAPEDVPRSMDAVMVDVWLKEVYRIKFGIHPFHGHRNTL